MTIRDYHQDAETHANELERARRELAIARKAKQTAISEAYAGNYETLGRAELELQKAQNHLEHAKYHAKRFQAFQDMLNKYNLTIS